MSSSKKSLTEKQALVEGFLDRIVGAVFNRTDKKARRVLDTLTQKDTAIDKANKELERANIKLRKAVQKRMKTIKKSDKADAKLAAVLGKHGF
tara:strand:+ start:1098 stop:1376 length:279 start_codon:yes stop_codon:yes gene_type:complete